MKSASKKSSVQAWYEYAIDFGFASEGPMRRLLWLILVLCFHACSESSAQAIGAADLIGTWDDVTPEPKRVGYQLPRPGIILTFEGSVCTWKERGGGKFRQSLFNPVHAGPHRGLDFVTVSGGAFWTTRAVFRVEGDTLTIKEGALDRPRPTDLTSEEFGAGIMENWAPVYVYKRRTK
jgi:hypothetical protein